MGVVNRVVFMGNFFNMLERCDVSFSTGHYNIPTDVVQAAFTEYTASGSIEIIKNYTFFYDNADQMELYSPCEILSIYKGDDKLPELGRLIKKMKTLAVKLNDQSLDDYLQELSLLYAEVEGYSKAKHAIERSQFSQKIKRAVKKRDGMSCVLCGIKDKLEVDHIRELRCGGDNSMNNLQTLCKPCHLKKTIATRRRN